MKHCFDPILHDTNDIIEYINTSIDNIVFIYKNTATCFTRTGLKKIIYSDDYKIFPCKEATGTMNLNNIYLHLDIVRLPLQSNFYFMRENLELICSDIFIHDIGDYMYSVFEIITEGYTYPAFINQMVISPHLHSINWVGRTHCNPGSSFTLSKCISIQDKIFYQRITRTNMYEINKIRDVYEYIETNQIVQEDITIDDVVDEELVPLRYFIYNSQPTRMELASANGDYNYVLTNINNSENLDLSLSYASEFGHLNIVVLLVENGADLHADNDNALRVAAAKGHLNIVNYLAVNGANISAQYDDALLQAVIHKHLDVVQYLVNNGASHIEEAINLAEDPNIKEYLEFALNDNDYDYDIEQ